MTEGTSQGLFIVVAIVIFGIFVSLSYNLFGKEGLSNGLTSLFKNSTEQAEDSLIRKNPTLLYSENREINNGNSNYTSFVGYEEFVQHDLDISEYVDVYGEGIYTLEFDIKSTKDGPVRVYTMNGNSYKYTWRGILVNSTTEYQTFKLDLDVYISDVHPDAVKSMLAFWGGGSYQSEIIPTIKNVNLYKTIK